MKHIIYTLAFGLLLSTSQPVTAAKDNEYYRHLKFRETPFSTYQGIQPMEEFIKPPIN